MSKKSPYNPIKKNAFAPIPLNILKHQKLTPGSKLVYGYLCSRYGKDGRVSPKITTIATAIGCKERQVRNLIAELRENGLIKTIRTGRAFEYIFIPFNESDRQNIASRGRQDIASHKGCDRQYTASRDRQDIAGLLYNNKRKQLKDNNNVVVVSSEITFLLDRIREGVNLEDRGLLNALQEGLSKYGQNSMIQRIEYANQKADGNYSGFLVTMIRQDWSIPDIVKEQKLASSTQPSPSISLGGKTVLYKGEKYTVDPVALCIWLKSGAVLPIGKIIQGVNKGTIKVIDDV